MQRIRICHAEFVMPRNRPMICSGTTLAPHSTMLAYLTAMYEEMIAWHNDPVCYNASWHGGDQAILNYLYYSNHLDDLAPEIYLPRQGRINTIGVLGKGYFKSEAYEDFKTWPKDKKDKRANWMHTEAFDDDPKSVYHHFTDPQGFLLDQYGDRSKVVHQFDRFSGTGLSQWAGANFKV